MADSSCLWEELRGGTPYATIWNGLSVTVLELCVISDSSSYLIQPLLSLRLKYLVVVSVSLASRVHCDSSVSQPCLCPPVSLGTLGAVEGVVGPTADRWSALGLYTQTRSVITCESRAVLFRLREAQRQLLRQGLF